MQWMTEFGVTWAHLYVWFCVAVAVLCYWNTYQIFFGYGKVPDGLRLDRISDMGLTTLFVLLPLIPVIQAIWLWFVLKWSWESFQLAQADKRAHSTV